MDAILQKTFSNSFYCLKIVLFVSNFSETFVKDLNSNNPALVQIMAWCQVGDKPLLEAMLA